MKVKIITANQTLLQYTGADGVRVQLVLHESQGNSFLTKGSYTDTEVSEMEDRLVGGDLVVALQNVINTAPLLIVNIDQVNALGAFVDHINLNQDPE